MASKPKLRFATFNLYNLQIPGEPMYRGKTYDNEQYRAKVAWTAMMLRRIDADIIGFQELWNPQALADAFSEAGLDKDYELISREFPGQIATAAAVKKEHSVRAATWIRDFPKEVVLGKRSPEQDGNNLPDYKISVDVEQFSREILRLKIQPKQGSREAPEITLFVAHLKSKLPIRLDKEERDIAAIRKHQTALGSALSTIRRAAESAAFRVLLTKEMSGNSKPVVALGDLNDTEHSVTNTIITGDPSYRLTVTSRAGARSDSGLYSSSSLQEYRSLRDVHYTHGFKGRLETLDHILVSEQFYDYSKNRIWSFDEMRVFNDFVEDDDGASGDHGIVTSTFVFAPVES